MLFLGMVIVFWGIVTLHCGIELLYVVVTKRNNWIIDGSGYLFFIISLLLCAQFYRQCDN